MDSTVSIPSMPFQDVGQSSGSFNNKNFKYPG